MAVVFLTCFLGSTHSEPDPGFVGVNGAKENRLQHTVKHLVSDPGFLGLEPTLDSLNLKEPLRPLEPVRTLRELRSDGMLVLQGGRDIALRGVVFDSTGTLANSGLFQSLQAMVKGKQARLLFEKETRDPRGNLSAYVYLSDRTLLNEQVLRYGFGRLDTSVDLSPQYRHRLSVAERFAREKQVGIWAPSSGAAPIHAPSKTLHPKLSKPRGGLFGVQGWTSTLDWAKRSGKNQPAGKRLFPRDRNQPSDSTDPGADPESN
ncbi:MAG: thermonuclease family protein [Candidatus Omnitrophica bacterium]|nr:thermonuclease family protein [Candidatus Omnitrophota bacterium]